MLRRFFRNRVIFVLLPFAIFPISIQASPLPPTPTPTDVILSETFTSPDELFSLRYPAEWEVADYNTVGDPYLAALGLVFSLPEADTQAMVVVTDVTGELAYPEDMNTPAELMDAARNGHELVVGPMNTLLELEELQVGERDAVKLVINGQTGTSLQVVCALNDQWVATLIVQADDPVRYEAAGIAVLASLRFALGESFIASPVLHAELPEEWVFYHTEQEVGYYSFAMRPRGDLSFQGDRIAIALTDLTGTPLLDTITADGLEPGMRRLLSSGGAFIQTEVESREFAGYDTMTAGAWMQQYPDVYYQYLIGMIDDSWLLMVIGISTDESTAADIVANAEDIIEGAELTLPSA